MVQESVDGNRKVSGLLGGGLDATQLIEMKLPGEVTVSELANDEGVALFLPGLLLRCRA